MNLKSPHLVTRISLTPSYLQQLSCYSLVTFYGIGLACTRPTRRPDPHLRKPAPSDPLFPRSRTRKTRFFDTRPTRTSETDTSTQYTVFTSTLGHRTQGWHSPGMNVEDVPKSGKSSDPETRTRITRKTRKCGYTYQELAHTSEVTRFTPGFVR